MAFVLERINEGESKWERYGVDEIKRHINIGEYCSPNACAVDHDRNIYLIEVAMERDDEHRPIGLLGFVFYWHGRFLWIELRDLEFRGGHGGPAWARQLVTYLGLMDDDVMFMGGEEGRRLPPELEEHRDEILADLYDALLAHRGGLLSSSMVTTYDLTLDLAEGV